MWCQLKVTDVNKKKFPFANQPFCMATSQIRDISTSSFELKFLLNYKFDDILRKYFMTKLLPQ